MKNNHSDHENNGTLEVTAFSHDAFSSFPFFRVESFRRQKTKGRNGTAGHYT